MADRWTLQQMLERAARGLGKIDVEGSRGASRVSLDEIEAMAGALVAFGLVAIPPGGPVPPRLVVSRPALIVTPKSEGIEE